MKSHKYTNKTIRMKKKSIIITLICLLSVIALVLVLLFKHDNSVVPSNSDDTIASTQDTPTPTTYDTTPAGDASTDPENTEITEENGADVNAEDLSVEQGTSNGIDVSVWQGKIDWQKVKKSGMEFAFIRMGYRGENGIIYKDDNADYNIQQAQKAGVLVGVYFFSTAINETEAEEEARWVLKAIEGYSISYPVVYDCEGFRSPSSRMHSLTAAQRTNNALAFLDNVSDAGYDAMLYGALSEVRDSTYWDISRVEAEHKIWVAQYPAITYPDKAEPDYDERCDAWQYTNKGTVNGVSGNVDMVVCYFTREKAQPKNESVEIEKASAPLTEEEKMYTAVNEKVTAKEVTNLRTAATTKSDIVVALKNGETVIRTGIGTNGWSKLQYNGQTVYAITSYLTTDMSYKSPEVPAKDIVSGNTFEPKDDKVTAIELVNLRSLPTTINSEVIGTLKSGDFLQRTAISDKGWSRLVYEGKVVYAITSYLTDKVTTPTTTPTTTPSADKSDGFTSVDEQVTAISETNLRTAPSTQDSQVVYTLKNGEYVKRIGTHPNGWSKLEYNGSTVYAITSYLTK